MQMGIWLAVDMFMADLLWRWMPNLTMRIANGHRGPDGIKSTYWSIAENWPNMPLKLGSRK